MARPQPATDAIAARLLRNRVAATGLILLGTVVVVAAAAPLLPLADPDSTDLARRLLPPLSAGHPLGTDQLGRDVLARLLWGTRVSLAVGVFATLIACAAGTTIGLVAGYRGGLTDSVLMRAIDVLLAFPYLLLALAIVAALGPGLRNAMIAIAVVNVPFFARAVRGATLDLRQRDFITAARLAGYGHLRIVTAELLPNVLPAIVVMMSTTVGWMILETAGLSFLGLGAQPPQADLGSMLGDARRYALAAPLVAMLPGLAILLVVIAINLAGDGLRDALDPRLAVVPAARGRAAPRRAPRAPARAGTGRALVEIEDLSVSFFSAAHEYRAVNGISLRLARGEALGLAGESGCGKTATALAIIALLRGGGRVTAGRVVFDGEDLSAATPARLRALRGERIGYIAQDPMGSLNPVLTAGGQIAEVLRAHRSIGARAARERSVELLDQVRIADPRPCADAYPHELSGGMRQRVAIAMALANSPDLIIADEPTTALDVTTQAGILDLLADLQRERGAALLFITHDLALLGRVCARVAVMYAGRIVETAPVARLLATPCHPYTRALLACIPELGNPDKPIQPIEGLPPPADALPPGCAFAPRCPRVIDACRRAPIPLDAVGPAHRVRCIRAPGVQGRGAPALPLEPGA